jgi:hypothetical protein
MADRQVRTPPAQQERLAETALEAQAAGRPMAVRPPLAAVVAVVAVQLTPLLPQAVPVRVTIAFMAQATQIPPAVAVAGRNVQAARLTVAREGRQVTMEAAAVVVVG